MKVELTTTQIALITALEAIRPQRLPLIEALEALGTKITEVAETYMNDPGQRKALVGDVHEALEALENQALPRTVAYGDDAGLRAGVAADRASADRYRDDVLCTHRRLVPRDPCPICSGRDPLAARWG